MRKVLIMLTFLTPLLASAANPSEINMRAGLWQIETTSDLLLLAPHIPPDQMKNLKDLAGEYGLEMPQVENGAAISQACMTQEMADQKTLPNFYQSESGCSSKKASRSGNNYKVDFVCNGADLKGNGGAEGAITNPEAFAGQTNFIGTAQGNPVNERANVNGKWVNASCSAVKPL